MFMAIYTFPSQRWPSSWALIMYLCDHRTNVYLGIRLLCMGLGTMSVLFSILSPAAAEYLAHSVYSTSIC